MKRKANKAAALIAAVCVCAGMSVPALAQDVIEGAGTAVEGVGRGAADIVEGIGDGAANAIDSVGEGIGDMTGANDRRGDSSAADGNDYGKDENDVAAEDDRMYDTTQPTDRNPATGGIPFLPAGLIAVSAAGLAYITKKRNTENGI